MSERPGLLEVRDGGTVLGYASAVEAPDLAPVNGVVRLVGATPSLAGLVTTGDQSWAGVKTFEDGVEVSGGTHLFTGTYTDWRATDAQELTMIRQPPAYVNHYYKPARKSGGQFGTAVEMVSGPDAALPSGHVGQYIVGSYMAATTPADNTGITSLYGGNSSTMIGEDAAIPEFVRGFEIDIGNDSADVPIPEPSGSLPGPSGESIIGLEIISGGTYKSTYGVRVAGTTSTNRFQTAVRLGSDAFHFRALELLDPPVSQGGGVIAGQMFAASAGADTVNFSRNTDSGLQATANFIRLRSHDLLTDLFKVDVHGGIYGNDVVKAPYIQATGDLGGGAAGVVQLTNSHNAGAARGAGVGTILFADGTSRNCVGFLKFWIGTVAYHVPLFAAN